MVKYRKKSEKMQFFDLDLWPMILKFNSVLTSVEVNVHATFHQTKFSGLSIIVLTEKNKQTKYSATVLERVMSSLPRTVGLTVTVLTLVRCKLLILTFSVCFKITQIEQIEQSNVLLVRTSSSSSRCQLLGFPAANTHDFRGWNA